MYRVNGFKTIARWLPIIQKYKFFSKNRQEVPAIKADTVNKNDIMKRLTTRVGELGASIIVNSWYNSIIAGAR